MILFITLPKVDIITSDETEANIKQRKMSPS